MNVRKNMKYTNIIKKAILYISIISMVSIISCEKHFTGPGPQPKFIEEGQHIPMLNIFGILRPDKLNSFAMSYIHIERTISATSDDDSLEVIDAEVILYKYEGTLISDTINFEYTNFDSAFSSKEYRPVLFNFEALETYMISCIAAGLPELTSVTTIPSIPKIVNEQISNSSNILSFSIEPDSLAELYDIYLLINNELYTTRLLKPETGNIPVTLEFTETNATAGKLTIYAYDLNLSEYLTYSIYIKPNTYQPPFSTVENGYGSFGSLNILNRTVSLE